MFTTFKAANHIAFKILSMKQLYILLFLTIFQFSPTIAQLPKGFTDTEQQLVGQFQFRSAQFTPPPTVPVRAAAEWEEVEYLVITWVPQYQNILRQIVAVGVTECKVIITTQNQASVQTYLTNNGISLDNVIFMDAPWNSIWIRDYAGNTVYSNDVGDRAIVDWIYNRPRPADNVMPSAHATLTGIPIYVTDSGTNDLVNTGGNYMSDGLGTAFASELILEENAAGNPYSVSVKTEEQIDEIMFNYMGIDNFIKMPTLPYDGIHHIDMHMKLLDEETLLVSRYPEGVADGPQILENIADVTSNYVSAFGTQYKIRFIDAPPSTGGLYPDNGGSYRTFTNAVFVNKSIILPLYRPEVDAAAIARYQELMPGYNIVGIDVDNAGENLISSSGAIHCITHTIGVENPLLIVHNAVETAQPTDVVPLTAMIKHISGIATAFVYYREQGTTDWLQAAMTPTGDDNWTTNITMPANGNDIEYYIWTQAVVGKMLTRPLPAPTAFWTINAEDLTVDEWARQHISGPYPNPAKELVNFNLDRIDGPIKITINSVLGQNLYSNITESGDGVITLNLEPSWKGTLFVTFEGNFGKVTRKIIKL